MLTRGPHGCIAALPCLVCRPNEYLDSFNILLKAAAARVGSFGRVSGDREVGGQTRVLFCVLLIVLPATTRLRECGAGLCTVYPSPKQPAVRG